MVVTPSVYVVDRDEVVRQRVCEMAQRRNLPAEAFPEFKQWLLRLNNAPAACLVLDYSIFGKGIFEILSRLGEEQSPVPAIVTAAEIDVSTAVQMMEAGALTLLEKPLDWEELESRLEQAIEIHRAGRRTSASRTKIRGLLQQLSPLDQQILERLIGGEPNKVIARRMDVSLRTVERCRARIFQKLGVKGIADLVRVVNAGR